MFDSGHLSLAVLPRGQYRQEHVVTILARSRHHVGRLSNMVIAYRLTQYRFCPRSRSSSKRLG